MQEIARDYSIIITKKQKQKQKKTLFQKTNERLHLVVKHPRNNLIPVMTSIIAALILHQPLFIL